MKINQVTALLKKKHKEYELQTKNKDNQAVRAPL
jgi:hypothetical protein